MGADVGEQMRWLALVFALAACGTNNDDGDVDPFDQVDGRTSAQCPELSGMEALAWDYYNGEIVTDPVLPPPLPLGGTYSHTDFPLLGFTHPPGWTPFELRDFGVTGVNLIRDDDRAIWRYVSLVIDGAPTSGEVIDFEVVALRDFFGLAGAGAVVCRQQFTGELSPGTGIIGDQHNVLIRIEGQSLILNTRVTTVPDLPQRNVYVHLVSAPTTEWPDRLYDTFIAIDWQMLVGGSGDSSDRDGDGWLDQFDDFPDDPNRH